MTKMKKDFLELLNIYAVSGKEKPVRKYLQKKLEGVVDTMKVDDYGNLLAEKSYGDGDGAVVLLSAHMDTVRGVLKNRNIIQNNDIIMADVGALGADDRAGIAIILDVLDRTPRTGFNGVIKIAFSREEEIGCIGAGKIKEEWYEDVDLAIVVDRRGNRDIVTGCFDAFCSDSVGYFMEDVSKMADMNWQCVEGGISDALVFSSVGVNSINISAGYYNEHTDREYASLTDMKDSVKLIIQTLAVINTFRFSFGDVPHKNEWVNEGRFNSYSSGYETYNYYDHYYEDSFENDVWAEEKDINGDTYVYEVGDSVIIQQGENEIILSRGAFKSMMNQVNGCLEKSF